MKSCGRKIAARFSAREQCKPTFRGDKALQFDKDDGVKPDGSDGNQWLGTADVGDRQRLQPSALDPGRDRELPGGLPEE